MIFTDFNLYLQVIMQIQKWDAKHIMFAYSILLGAPCTQHHLYAQTEHFFNNKYLTVIGGMHLVFNIQSIML